METIYEEIPHVRAQLREEADKLAASVCGPIGAESVAEQSAAAMATLVEIEQEDRARFRDVYLRKVRPYLADPEAPHAELADPQPHGRGLRFTAPACSLRQCTAYWTIWKTSAKKNTN